jgi:hypothetical protein
MINLNQGWKQHANVPGGFHLEYDDGVVEVSVVTGPKGAGLMGHNNPGQPVTYEAWFAGMDGPMGYLSLDEVKGIIRYLHARYQETLVPLDAQAVGY